MLNRNKIVPFMLLFFLIIGTFSVAFNPVSASELVENSWNVKTSTSHTRMLLEAIAVGGKIYAIGGFEGGVVHYENRHIETKPYASDINERYDPAKDTWVTLESMPTARAYFGIVAYQGKIYCIGGGTMEDVFNVVEVYDVVTDSWSTKTSLPVSEKFIQAHVVDGKIFVVTQQAVYVYDPIDDFWAKKTSIPIQGTRVFSAVVDNKIIIVDQQSKENYDSRFSTWTMRVMMKVMIYNPTIDVWSEGQTSPMYTVNTSSNTSMPIAAGVTTGVYAPQKIYAVGISDYVYDPVEDTWSTVTGIATPDTYSSVAVVDDILYVIRYDVNLQYVPIGYVGALSSTTLATPVTGPPSGPFSIDSNSESEPPDTPVFGGPPKHFLTGQVVIVAVGLTIILVMACLVIVKTKCKPIERLG
jgi:hypothetical protein